MTKRVGRPQTKSATICFKPTPAFRQLVGMVMEMYGVNKTEALELIGTFASPYILDEYYKTFGDGAEWNKE